jgi:ATP-dependent helicase/nuclease subunit A
VNHVQDALLKLVSRQGGPGHPRNLFAVGDVKQCIYAFRLAAPDVFLKKYHSSTPLADAAESGGEHPKASEEGRRERVSLSHNFRSREEILRAVNHLFARLMTPGSVGLAYDRGAALVPGAEFPSDGNARLHTLPAELHVVEAKPLEEEEDAGADKDTANEGREDGEESEGEESPADWAGVEREAFLIGKRILEMTGGGGCDPSLAVRVFDRSPAGAGAGEDSAGGMRPAAFRDIVVLLRAVRGWAERFTGVFQRLGIPVFTDQGQGLLGTVEVRDVLNLLRVIDNPLQDIPLAAVLRSPFENWTDTNLTRIRLKKRDGCFHEALRAAAEGFRDKKAGLDSVDSVDPMDSVDPVAPDTRVAEKASLFLERLEGWRTRARREPLGDLVAAIYDETGYPAWALGQSGGENRQANLLRFHRIARQFDQFSRQGLSRFLRFVEQLEEEEGDYGAAAPVAEGQNVVRILSIHKSKGLEFPIVFLAGLGKKFNLRDTHAALLFTRGGGMGARVVDAERLVRYPTPVYRMLQREKKREALAEELRILYVAATRARERLILTGSARKVEDYVEKRRGRGEALQGGPLPAAEVLSAQTPLDWVIPALADCWAPDSAAHAAPFRCFAHDLDEIRGWSLESGVRSPESGAKKEPTDHRLQTTDSQQAGDRRLEAGGKEVAKTVEEILSRIEWVYPHEVLSNCPARIAASELKRRWGAGEEEGERSRPLVEQPGVKIFSQSSVLSPQSSVLSSQPSALSTHSSVLSSQHSALSTQHSPVERGAWTHLVLQQLDLLKPLDYAGISAQVDEMIGRGLLSEEQRSALDFGAIERFFASELGRRMLAIPPSKVWRETPFLIGLAPSEARMEDLAGYDEGERIRAQGMIDCLFEEEGGRLILVDYKTDAISAAELEARVELYRPQMRIYARAVEAVFGKPPDEAWLYFLALGKAEKA